MKVPSLLVALCAVLVPIAATVSDDPQPGPKEIVLGMSAPFTGPASGLGEDMRAGMLAAIDETNRAGGVRGMKLRLISLDDGYEPERAAANVRQLIQKDHALALVGCVGTPTAVAAVPIAVENKTLYFGAFTGAGLLRRDPPERYVINFRASYAEETGEMVDALVKHAGLKPQDIAFFTQRDAYGDAGFAGGMAALKRHGLSSEGSVTHGRYERNTLAVEDGLADILSAPTPPRAVVMVGAYAPCAKFIKLARGAALDAILLNVSFVGASALQSAAGKEGEGVIVTQVVPVPGGDEPVCKAFRDALRASNPEAQPRFGSLEGYAVMRVLVKGLEKTTGEPTRESIIDGLTGLDRFDVGLGAPLRLTAESRQACHTVWPSVMRDGKLVPMRWEELGKSAPPSATAPTAGAER